VLAFQWTATSTIAAVRAAAPSENWLWRTSFHAPGDGSLHVPTGTAMGTLRANPTDWVLLNGDGTIDVMPHSVFNAQYS